MKKLLFSCAITIASLSTSHAAVVYNDFAPDLTMALGGTLSFDLDGDMNDDITFTSTGTGASDYVISATGNVEFAVQGGGGTAYTETLFVAKLVDANKSWVASSARIASAANKNIAGANEFFIGLRVPGSNGFFYGWLLVELKSNLEFIVKSAAFETSASSIVVGNTGAAILSLDDTQVPQFDVYPTLVDAKIQLSSDEILEQASIQSIDGAFSRVYTLGTRESILNLEDLPKGAYLIQIKSVKGYIHSERILKN